MTSRSGAKCARPKCPKTVDRYGLCTGHYRASSIRGFVDAGPARQRVEDLRKAGVPLHRIAELSGLHRDTLMGLGTWTAQGTVRRLTHFKIMSVPLPTAPDPVSSAYVDATGTRRRLHALVRAGHGYPQLAEHLGIRSETVRGYTLRPQVLSRTAARIADLFDELQLVPGPSAKAVRFAEQQGWPLPLAWDEDTIDNPNAQPHHIPDGYVSSIERYRELRELGVPEMQIPARLGIRAKSLARQLLRHGLPVSPALAELAQEERHQDRAVAS
jgi:hypothetical protein